MNAFALYIDSLCYQMATGINGRGGQERLAELLGVNPSVIGQWRKGQDIRLSSLSSALEKLGGDVSRALPNYSPNPLSEPHYSCVGRVSAGYACTMYDDADVIHSSFSEILKHSKNWTSTYGDTCVLRVHGDSMEPDYQNGDALFCRAPIGIISDGTPVVAVTKGGETTFKIYSRHNVGGNVIIELKPLNHGYKTQLYAEKDVQIKFIVLKSLRG